MRIVQALLLYVILMIIAAPILASAATSVELYYLKVTKYIILYVPADLGRFYFERTGANSIGISLYYTIPSSANIYWTYGFEPCEYYWIFVWNYEDEPVIVCFEVTLYWL